MVPATNSVILNQSPGALASVPMDCPKNIDHPSVATRQVPSLVPKLAGEKGVLEGPINVPNY